MAVKWDVLCQLAVTCSVTVICDGLLQLVMNAAWLLDVLCQLAETSSMTVKCDVLFQLVTSTA